MAGIAKELAAALAQHAPIIAQKDAVEDYSRRRDSSVEVSTVLDPYAQEELRTVTSVPIRFSNSSGNHTGHSYVQACRDVVRQLIDKVFDPRTTNLSVLVVGASQKQVDRFKSNPNVVIHIGGFESKDMSRTYMKLYSRLLSVQARDKPQPGGDPMPPPPVKNGGIVTSSMLVDLMNQCYKCRFTNDLMSHRVDVVYFPDSFYNFNEGDYVRLMTTVGAKVAYGYGMLPMNLLFDHVAPSRHYKYNEFYNTEGTSKIGGSNRELFSSVTFDSENGYAHSKQRWSTLLRSPVMKAWNGAHERSLVVELNHFVDIMTVFTITVAAKEMVVRTISLRPHQKCMRVLNLSKSHNMITYGSRDLVYTTIQRDIVVSIIEYIASLPDSVIYAEEGVRSIVTYVRRRRPGVTISMKSLQTPWNLDGVDIEDLCRVCYIYSIMQRDAFDNIEDSADSMLSRFTSSVGNLLENSKWFGWLHRFYVWIVKSKFAGKLILSDESDVLQKAHSKGFHRRDQFVIPAPSEVKNVPPPAAGPNIVPSKPPNDEVVSPKDASAPFEEDRPPREAAEDYPVSSCCREKEEGVKCLECDIFHSKLGSQRVHHKRGHTESLFSCTLKEAKDIIDRIRNTAPVDPDGTNILTSTINNFCDYMEKNFVEYRRLIDASYIDGPPGNGKSTASRALIESDPTAFGVFVPMNKLKGDYDGFPVCTTHNIYKIKFKKYIIIDEFTCFDYDILRLYLGVTGTMVEKLYFVGDDRQCRIRENANEGKYIGDYLCDVNEVKFNMDQIDTYSLKVHFRCPKNVVDLLNKSNYDIYSYREDVVPMKYVSLDYWLGNAKNLTAPRFNGEKVLVFAPSSKGIEALYPDVQNAKELLTTRKVQGSTGDRAFIGVTQANDAVNIDVTNGDDKRCLLNVTLSRATGETTLVISPNEFCKRIVAEWDLKPLAADMAKMWGIVPMVSLNTKEVIEPTMHPGVTRAGCDSYLLADEMLPLMTSEGSPEFGDDLNEANSEKMNNTNVRPIKIDLDKVMTRRNANNVPKDVAVEKYHLGPGYGLVFDNKGVTKVAAIAERYNASKPSYPLTVEAENLVQKIHAKDVSDNWNPERHRLVKELLKSVQSDSGQIQAQAIWLRVARDRNYHGRTRKDDDFLSIDNASIVIKHVRQFMLKADFKPVVGYKGLDVDKVAQGIISWSPEENIIFGYTMRFVTALRQWVLNHWTDMGTNVCMTDHQTSPADFADDYASSYNWCFQRLGVSEIHHSSFDTKKCDSFQNMVTQRMDEVDLLDLGFSKDFTTMYLEASSDTRVVCDVADFRSDGENHSGKPGTKTVNETVCRKLANYVVEVKGPCITAFAGDDVDKAHLPGACDVSQIRIMEINTWICQYGLTYMQGPVGEFCGNLIVGGSIAPSMIRKVNRIIATKFRDYKEYAVVAESYRQFIDDVLRRERYEEYIGGTALMIHMEYECDYDRAVETAHMMWDFIISMGHLSEEQWSKVVKPSNQFEYIFSSLDHGPIDIARMTTKYSYEPKVVDKRDSSIRGRLDTPSLAVDAAGKMNRPVPKPSDEVLYYKPERRVRAPNPKRHDVELIAPRRKTLYEVQCENRSTTLISDADRIKAIERADFL